MKDNLLREAAVVFLLSLLLAKTLDYFYKFCRESSPKRSKLCCWGTIFLFYFSVGGCYLGNFLYQKYTSSKNGRAAVQCLPQSSGIGRTLSSGKSCVKAPAPAANTEAACVKSNLGPESWAQIFLSLEFVYLTWLVCYVFFSYIRDLKQLKQSPQTQYSMDISAVLKD